MKLVNKLNRSRRRILLAVLTLALLITSPRAQQPASPPQQSSEDRIALHQALLDLTNPWTVMCVAAHPDDEDGTSLIVMRRKYGAHTVSLFSTFGEGGQNAIGPELYEELGAIRARETMAASEIQGSEPHFLGLVDFGFSKSRDETFQKWGHEEALRRMVLHIRKLRPDVIITNHSTTSNDHGHHQATARLVVEAFDAAADPMRFPEQLKGGIATWQVQRLFVRVRGNQTPPAITPVVTIDPNGRDPVRGTVFAEQALSALQKHATQGPWPKTFAEFTARFRAFSGQSGATGQMPLIRYRLAREAKGAEPLPKESQSFLAGLRLPNTGNQQIAIPTINDQPLLKFINDRAAVVRALARSASVYRDFNPQSLTNDRAALMIRRISDAAAVAAGAKMLVETGPVFVPGTFARVEVTFKNTGPETLSDFGCKSTVPSFGHGGSLQPAANARSSQHRRRVKPRFSIVGSWVINPESSNQESDSFQVPINAPVNLPISKHLYEPTALGVEVKSQCTVGLPGASPERFVITKTTRVDVGPPFEIANIRPNPLVTIVGGEEKRRSSTTLTLDVINHRGFVQGSLIVEGRRERLHLNLRPFESQSLRFNALQLPHTLAQSTADSIAVRFLPSKSRAARHLKLLNAIDQAEIRLLASPAARVTARVPVIRVNARVASNLRVGYIRGFDFSLPQALNALGVESKELSADEVKTADLSKYTSIIVDNRVYESKPELIAVNQQLLDYAQAGGNLIVFYHRIDEFNPNPQRNRPQLSPYKLILGNERITDENAPITFLEPEHSLLNTPNKLNQEDFKGWIQERGLYYPREWDPQFKALLQSNDPNEQPLKGGLLVADYSKGHYIYTSMVWYRQLRAGVPGAYRMLANMISYSSEGKR